MSIQLEPIISVKDLSQKERDSILSHAIDLHLVGSDDADNIHFDIVEKRPPEVLHILRAKDGEQNIGVAYVLNRRDMVEMTMLIFHEFRGKHYTAPLVGALENFLRRQYSSPPSLCAEVHDHNPMRKELTEFLLRHGYTYSPDRRVFVKRLA